MVSIASAVRRIKEDSRAAIAPAVAEPVCRELGLEGRDTKLTPPQVIALLGRQVLHGNVSNPELIRLAGLKVTPAAYCTAKMRLPAEALREVSHRICDAAERALRQDLQHLWRGHRTWLLDGSGFSMPDTPELQAHFGQYGNQKPGCGFPVAHLMCLFSATSGLVRDVVPSPLRTHDLATAAQVHPHLQPGDIVIADTAFSSYFHIAALSSQGMHGIFPRHQKRIVDFTPHRPHAPLGKQHAPGQPTSRWVRRLGHDDQIVEYFKPPHRPSWMDPETYEAMSASIQVREIRRTIHRNGFRPMQIVVVTTLLDADEYPADEIVKLLKQRWAVETNLRHLKTTMGMDVLRTQTVEGVHKELWAFLLIYNLVRVIMLEAAAQQRVELDRVSFADALYWMRHGRPGEPMPVLIINPIARTGSNRVPSNEAPKGTTA